MKFRRSPVTRPTYYPPHLYRQQLPHMKPSAMRAVCIWFAIAFWVAVAFFYFYL